LGPDKVGPDRVGPVEVGLDELSPDKVGPGEAGKTGPDKVGPDDPNKVGLDRVGPDETQEEDDLLEGTVFVDDACDAAESIDLYVCVYMYINVLYAYINLYEGLFMDDDSDVVYSNICI
jgi:hypothetical protein